MKWKMGERERVMFAYFNKIVSVVSTKNGLLIFFSVFIHRTKAPATKRETIYAEIYYYDTENRFIRFAKSKIRVAYKCAIDTE